MKKGSTIFLKFVIFLIAIVGLIALITFPQIEGRAVNLSLVSIYSDPFIMYIYVASIPFFVALFQSFKLLGYVDKNKIFSLAAVKAVKNIKYCALSIVGFLVMALLYIRFIAAGDDAAGPTMVGMVFIFASVVIASAAAVFQKLLQNAVDIKSENDLTV